MFRVSIQRQCITQSKILQKHKKEIPKEPLFIGSIISVVGKFTVEIMELFECTQKVP